MTSPAATISTRPSPSTLAAVQATLSGLVSAHVASRVAKRDHTLWAPAAWPEARNRLGWVGAATTSRQLLPRIAHLRRQLTARGVTRIVLAGMGGSSLAPEVITQAYRVPLTILDSTSPETVRAVLAGGIEHTAIVISSKSGTTIETDAQRRVFEAAFHSAGLNPAERIVIVTDPHTPLDRLGEELGYPVFRADSHVGGRYSALTAFGLVPSGLAGAKIAELLRQAEAALPLLSSDRSSNPALVLAAVIAQTSPRKDKLGLIGESPLTRALAQWIEQLVAESTGKDKRGVLPVVLGPVSPEVKAAPADLVLAQLVVDDMGADPGLAQYLTADVRVAGNLGAQFLLWEFAVAIAGRILGVNPFDQPDVEAAKRATRALLETRPAPTPPAYREGGIAVRATTETLLADQDLAHSLRALADHTGPSGYLAIQAYGDPHTLAGAQELRDLLACVTGRPVTFGWGPRFLHSTGQYHKGGPRNGAFLQLIEKSAAVAAPDIPGYPFGFSQLIAAQAAGDAQVLAKLGRPVLSLTLTPAAIPALLAAARR